MQAIEMNEEPMNEVFHSQEPSIKKDIIKKK